jgi:transposase
MTENATITYGLDIGDKKTVICALDADGEVVEEARVSTTHGGFTRYFEGRDPGRVVLEVAVHSTWVSRLIEVFGHEVIVANPRRVKLISENHQKSDRVDAELLARLGRADPELLSPVRHRGEQAQTDMTTVRSRAVMVRARTSLIVSLRNMVKSQGLRIPSCSADSFYRRAIETLPEQLRRPLVPQLESIKKLTHEIRNCDKRIQNLCETKYPETEPLRQIKGVGAVTALTFVLLLDDPKRFPKSRTVGAYLGLTPRNRQSGNKNPELGISKVGDGYMRTLLVQSAHYILGPFGEDSALRRKGMRIVERGGQGAKNIAAVAVARTLACVLHRLWVTGDSYRAFPDGEPRDRGGHGARKEAA